MEGVLSPNPEPRSQAKTQKPQEGDAVLVTQDRPRLGIHL